MNDKQRDIIQKLCEIISDFEDIQENSRDLTDIEQDAYDGLRAAVGLIQELKGEKHEQAKTAHTN